MGVLATIRRDRCPNTITRENVQRKIIVSCNVADRDIGSVIADIQHHVAEEVPVGKDQYAGYYVQYGGQFDEIVDSFRVGAGEEAELRRSDKFSLRDELSRSELGD